MSNLQILVQEIPSATSHHLDVCLVLIPIRFYCLGVDASLRVHEIAGMVHRPMSEAQTWLQVSVSSPFIAVDD